MLIVVSSRYKICKGTLKSTDELVIRLLRIVSTKTIRMCSERQLFLRGRTYRLRNIEGKFTGGAISRNTRAGAEKCQGGGNGQAVG
jgi:hypothetical protein